MSAEYEQKLIHAARWILWYGAIGWFLIGAFVGFLAGVLLMVFA